MSPIVALRQILLSWCRAEYFGFGMTLLSLKLAKLFLFSVLVRHPDIRERMVLPTASPCRVYTALFVTPCRLWNDIGMCNDRKIISISGFRPPSWIFGTRPHSNMIVLQSAVNEATFDGDKNAHKCGVSCRNRVFCFR